MSNKLDRQEEKRLENLRKNAPKDLDNENFFGLDLDEEQRHFRNSIWDKNKIIIFCNARAGTGKTLVAVGTSLLLYYYGFYERIIYIMNPVQEQRFGFLPGDVNEKAEPYMDPLYDTLIKLGKNPKHLVISNTTDELVIRKDTDYKPFIETKTPIYMRGTNLRNSIVILDESQNMYTSEIMKVLTRVNDDCKVIVIGHSGQCDLYKNPQNSGFVRAMELFKSKKDPRCGICELVTNHRGWVSTVADELQSEIRI